MFENQSIVYGCICLRLDGRMFLPSTLEEDQVFF